MTDWMMVVLTAIYVIATILICIFNYLSAKASKEQTEELRRQYLEENRPFITVELIYERKFFYVLRFTNHGKRVANHVRISFGNSFLESMVGAEFHTQLVEQSSKECIIGIGQHYDLFLAIDRERDSLQRTPIQGHIAYSDAGLEYFDELDIDFSLWGPIYSVNSDIDDINKEIEKISKELSKISAGLTHFAKQ